MKPTHLYAYGWHCAQMVWKYELSNFKSGVAAVTMFKCLKNPGLIYDVYSTACEL